MDLLASQRCDDVERRLRRSGRTRCARTRPDSRFRRWRAEERSWARAGRPRMRGAATGSGVERRRRGDGRERRDSADRRRQRDVAPAQQRRVGAVIVAGGGREIGAQRTAASPARRRLRGRSAGSTRPCIASPCSRQATWEIATAWNQALACDATSTTASSRPRARRASGGPSRAHRQVVRPARGPVKARGTL